MKDILVDTRKKTYSGELPAVVRHSPKISSDAKVVYAELDSYKSCKEIFPASAA